MNAFSRCAAAALLLGAASVWAQEGDEIVIGASLPLTGFNAAAGQEGLAVIKATFNSINRTGGVNGRKLLLNVLDDEFNPEKAAANATKLSDSRAVALLNCWGTASCSAMMPIITKAGMPMVAGIAGGGPMRQTPGRFAFNVRPTTDAEIARMVNQMLTVGQTGIALVYQNDPFGKSGQAAAKGVFAKTQVTPLAELALERDGSNAAAMVSALQQLPALNSVIVIAAPPATVKFIPALRQAGLSAQVYNLAAQATRKVAADLGKYTAGVVFTTLVPSPWRDGVPVVREYQQVMNAAGGQQEFSYLGLEVFINTKVLVEALRKASKAVTREGVVSALETMGTRQYGPMSIGYAPGDREGSSYVGLTIIDRQGRFLE